MTVFLTFSGRMFSFGNNKTIFYEELTYSADIKFFDNLIINLTRFSTHSCVWKKNKNTH